MDIKTKKQLDSWRVLIDNSLSKYLKGDSGSFSEKIDSAMRYSVFSGGKRIRPVLAIASAEACGLKASEVLPAACALELIHTYSLIHDDLPSMDNSDYRRGKLTSHKKFNEGLAVLAGDALLTKAFELISAGLNSKKITPGQVIKAVEIVSKAAGPAGMIAGQVADTFLDFKKFGRRSQESLINYIHSHKTGDLIEASVTVGAVLAGADAKQLSALKKYGKIIGFVFQVVDDIFDMDENRLTYPYLFGREWSRKKASGLIEEAKEELKIFGKRAFILNELADYVVQRKN